MVIYIFKPKRVFFFFFFFLKKTTNPTLVYQQKSSTHTKKRLTFWLTVSTKHRHGLWYMLFQRDCSQKKKKLFISIACPCG